MIYLFTLQSLNALTNLLMQFKSLLRFYNKLHLRINSVKQIWELIFDKFLLRVFEFFKELRLLEVLWLIKVCGIGFCLYWFQIIFCNKCNPCTLWNKFRFCVCWDWLCFLEGIKIKNLSVGVLAKKSVCLEVFKVTFFDVV